MTHTRRAPGPAETERKAHRAGSSPAARARRKRSDPGHGPGLTDPLPAGRGSPTHRARRRADSGARPPAGREEFRYLRRSLCRHKQQQHHGSRAPSKHPAASPLPQHRTATSAHACIALSPWAWRQQGSKGVRDTDMSAPTTPPRTPPLRPPLSLLPHPTPSGSCRLLLHLSLPLPLHRFLPPCLSSDKDQTQHRHHTRTTSGVHRTWHEREM